MSRIIALVILVIPGLIAVIGVKLMRDTIFGILQEPFQVYWLQFLTGLIFFFIGLGFIGGFIFFRDQKRNKVQSRFQRTNTKKEEI